MARKTKQRYVGLWQGGYSYGLGDWQSDAELFESVEHAASTFMQRYHNSRRMVANPPLARWSLDGALFGGEHVQALETPNVDEHSSLTLVPVGWGSTSGSLREVCEGGAYSHLLEIGPRGGLKVTRS